MKTRALLTSAGIIILAGDMVLMITSSALAQTRNMKNADFNSGAPTQRMIVPVGMTDDDVEDADE